MSEDTKDFIVGVIVIVVIIAVIVLWVVLSRKRTRSKYWKGTITSKNIAKYTDEDGDVSESYDLLVALEGASKAKKISVSAAIYNSFVVGDVIEKRLGELQPSKV